MTGLVHWKIGAFTATAARHRSILRNSGASKHARMNHRAISKLIEAIEYGC